MLPAKNSRYNDICTLKEKFGKGYTMQALIKKKNLKKAKFTKLLPNKG